MREPIGSSVTVHCGEKNRQEIVTKTVTAGLKKDKRKTLVSKANQHHELHCKLMCVTPGVT